ncbi:hypothetical protein Moror_12062 [Moniliophthora roreri MCA 2997]|uniref:Uncharacterized protein n=1 Tax=Moniliophthora roreri (strain MCA 2997) TaxID=1381753 RepID=V2WPU5_MONRO|nr:hypothetical protein Moror_12062 [Moniliophthora roreri MCA 2997]
MILLYALSQSLPPSTLTVSTNTSSLFDPVTVILICTWVAIHPNIPRIGTHSMVVVYQNVRLMVIMVLGPEIIILWAMRQWYSARSIAEKYKDYGWGMPHAFFVIMGGFALYDGDTFHGYLWENQDIKEYIVRYNEVPPSGWKDDFHREHWDQIIQCHEKIKEVFSTPINPHPEDMSTVEGVNALSEVKESLVKSQPTCLLEYFLQKGYITITEDEIKDRSHADFIAKSIALIQTTWFILQVAAHAAEHLAVTELEIITVGFALLNFGTYVFWWNKPLRVRFPVQVTWQQQELPTSQLKKDDGGCMKAVQEGFTKTLDYICSHSFADEGPLVIQLILLPLWVTWDIIGTCLDLFGDNSLSIGEFSTRLKKDPPQLYITVYSIAAAFGAIHCIPWAFQFPTHTEQLLWQICAVAAAAAPIALGCMHWYGKLFHSTSMWLVWLIGITGVLLGLFYMISRLTLIILALMALRDLSPSAYQTIQWTTFVSHIG